METRRQIDQGRKIIKRSREPGLTGEELQQIIEDYDTVRKESGDHAALIDLIKDAYHLGVASGYRCTSRETEKELIRNIEREDGFVYRLKTVRRWRGLEVIEANLTENIYGLSLPWKKPGEYRIFINEELPEREKMEAFIHEMIHLYRGDHEKQEELERTLRI